MNTESTNWMNAYDSDHEQAMAYDFRQEKLHPPASVVEALIAMRANADTLIEQGASKEIWATYEDALIRHCQAFIERTKEWHKRI